MTITSSTTYTVEVAGFEPTSFNELTDAVKHAAKVVEALVERNGFSKREAAKRVNVNAVTVEEQTFASLLGEDAFDDEEPETPKVEGLSKAMQEAYDGMLYCYRKAVEAKSFEAWYAGSEEAYAEKRAKRVERLGERSFELFEKDARKRYELALEGVVGANAPMGTVKALERRGLVKYDGMRRVKLLNV